jgi:2-keto-4-pentenoate hydratase
MSNQKPVEQEDKPLDPVMENVRRKMVKLQLVSGGIMLVMLMVVLSAIVYKLTRPGKADVTQSASVSVPGEAPVTAIAALPTGFEVSDVALSGGQILFYGAVAGGDRKAIVFDIAAGRIVADVSVKTN